MSGSSGDLKILSNLNVDWTMGGMAKGNRSKRSALTGGRKRVARKFGSLEDVSFGPIDDFMGSDNEKQGVAILGCRFSEKVENIPIKKRRSLALSLQPQFGMSDLNFNGKRQCNTVDYLTRNKFSKISEENADTGKAPDSGEFCGIEILADVACNDGVMGNHGGGDLDKGNPLVEESAQVDSSATAATPAGIAVSPGYLVSEDKSEATPPPESSAPDSQEAEILANDNGVMEESVSSQSERLHWDLNVTMDAWGQPNSTTLSDKEQSSVQGVSTVCEPVFVSSESLEKPKVLVENSVGVVQSTSTVGSNNTKIHESFESHKKHEEVGDNLLHVKSSQICSNSSTEEPGNSVLHHVDSGHGKNVPLTTDNVLNRVVETVDKDRHVDLSSPLSHIVQLGNNVSENFVKVEACDVVLHKESDGNMSTLCAIDQAVALEHIQTTQDENVKAATHMHREVESVQVKVSANNHGFGCENQANDLGDCDVSPNSGLVSGGGVNCVDTKGKPSEKNLAVVSSSTADLGFEELIRKSSTSKTNPVNLTTEDNNSNETYGSEVYQADKADLVGAGEVHTDYGSQIEDGELRESDTRSWDGEVERLDYGSDFEEEEEIQFNGGGSGNNNGQKFSMELESSGNVMRNATECRNVVGRIRRDKDYYPSGVGRSRESNGEAISLIDVSDAVCRKDAIMRSRDNMSYNFSSRDRRESSSRRYIARDRATYDVRARSPRIRNSQQFYNSSSGHWDSHCSYSPTTDAAYTHRPKGGVLDTRNTYMLGGSITRSINKRRSPSDRDKASRWPTNGPSPVGDDTSPMRNRMRKFPQWRDRGIGVGDEYQRPIWDNNSRYSNHVSRGERSISPVRGRPHHISTYRKSWSRSRSRSSGHEPTRERNAALRRRSRSPDLRRNDQIIHRERPSFQKRFEPEHEEGFVSSARKGWFPPQRNSGSWWFNDRNDSFDDFRGRKQPPRDVFRRSQRLDSGSSICRFDSDDKFRPQLRKFHQHGEYDHSEDESERRKYGNRYEMIDRHGIRG